MKKLLLPFLFSLFCFSTYAQVSFSEPFDYPVGNLDGQGGWSHAQGSTGHFQVVSPGLTFSGYPLSGSDNAVSVAGNASGIEQETANLGVTLNSGDLFCSFLINVSSAPVTEDYIFGLIPSVFGPTYLSGRFFIDNDGSDNLAFGIHSGASTTAQALTSHSYQLNTTYLIVLKYSFIDGADNNTYSLFVIPAGTIPSSEPTPTVGPLTAPADEDMDDVDKITLVARNASVAATIDGIQIAGSWSDLFTVSGLFSSVKQESIVSVYPNPATEWINFSQPVSVELMNSTGATLLRKEETESLDISSLAEGLYILKCSAGDRTESKLIMVR